MNSRRLITTGSRAHVTVRPAVVADSSAVTEVLCESRRQFLPYAPLAHTDDEVRGWLAEVLLPAGGVYVAESGHQAVAMLAVSTREKVDWIDHLYVRPGWTGQGIGALLLKVAHAKLKPPVRLYTFQANSAARRFYERNGYQAVAFTDGHGNEERCPDVLYERTAPSR